MDDSTGTDFECTGQYGTIKFIRKDTFDLITSYPVDSENTTFGRDPKCNVRLYFHDVDPHHCTVEYDDGKAFLHVISPRGVLVDSSFVGEGQTVCLNNKSRFQIYLKLFEFEYPPAELRAKLLLTPRAKSRKALRMSMIPSAFILTPTRASPTLDMRILQSPIRPYKESPNEVVTFVESDQVAVVEDAPQGYSSVSTYAPTSHSTTPEEDSSLVALEEIDEESEEPEVFDHHARVGFNLPTSPSPMGRRPVQQQHRRSSSVHLPPPANAPPPTLRSPMVSSSLRQRDFAAPSPPRTPRPRRKGASLHRAVLVRSAHRAFVAAIEKQQEEDEVEEVVSPERQVSAMQWEKTPIQAVPALQLEESTAEEDAEGEEYDEGDQGEASGSGQAQDHAEPPAPSALSSPARVVRASLGLIGSILPSFSRSSKSPAPPEDPPSMEEDSRDVEVDERSLETTSSDEDPSEAEPAPMEPEDQSPTRRRPRVSFSDPPTRPKLSPGTPQRPTKRFQLYTPQNRHSRAQHTMRLLNTVAAAPSKYGLSPTTEEENMEENEDMEETQPSLFGPALDLDKPSMIGKPVRPKGRMTLDDEHQILAAVEVTEQDDPDALKKAAELRTQERQMKLAALESASSGLPDPSTRRTSTHHPNPFQAPPSAQQPKPKTPAVLPTPERRRYASLGPDAPAPVPALLFNEEPTVMSTTETEESMKEESPSESEGEGEAEGDDGNTTSLDDLKRSIAVMKQDSVARASRLSVGGREMRKRLSVPALPLHMVLSQGDFEGSSQSDDGALADVTAPWDAMDLDEDDKENVWSSSGEGSLPPSQTSGASSPRRTSISLDNTASAPPPPTALGEVFLLPEDAPYTPRFGGIREMFKVDVAKGTTLSGGLEEMFPTLAPAPARVEAEEDADVTGTPRGDVSIESARTASTRNDVEMVETPSEASSSSKALGRSAIPAPSSRTRAKPASTATSSNPAKTTTKPQIPISASTKSTTSRREAAKTKEKDEQPPSKVPPPAATRRAGTRSAASVEPTAPPPPTTTASSRSRRTPVPAAFASAPAKPSSTSKTKTSTRAKATTETLAAVDEDAVDAPVVHRRTRNREIVEDEEEPSSRPMTRARTRSPGRPSAERASETMESIETTSPSKRSTRASSKQPSTSVTAEASNAKTAEASSSKSVRAKRPRDSDSDDEALFSSLPPKKGSKTTTGITSAPKATLEIPIKRSTKNNRDDEEDADDSNPRKRRKPSPQDLPVVAEMAPKRTVTGLRRPATSSTTARKASSSRSVSSTTTGPNKENTPDAIAEPVKSTAASKVSKVSARQAPTTSKASSSRITPKDVEGTASATRSLRTRVKK